MKIYTLSDPIVVQLLKNGAIGVVPTDTVYGLVTLLDNRGGVKKILNLKERPDAPIGTVLVGSVVQLKNVTDNNLLEVAEKFWPAPVSVVLPLDSTYNYAHKGLGSLPFRIPAYSELQNLASTVGLIATTSANITGTAPVTNISEALELFGNKVDFYVDGGELINRKASKIVKIKSDKTIEVLREG